MEKVVIAAALRTPSGKLLGSLSGLSAPELASVCIKGILRNTGIDPAIVNEVILGNVLSAGIGQNPGRQAALKAGLPDTIAAFTVNKVCASGMKAVALGVQAITFGEADVIIAGGMESMSNAPFLAREMRKGRKYGDTELVDSMVHDGLWDCYYDSHMGSLCEFTSERYNITREEQDRFALNSHMKAARATENGSFRDEIEPVRLNSGAVFDKDETIRTNTNLEKLSRLKPAFREDGTVTAGNSPGLNDGAAALLLMSEKKAEELKLKPLAEILWYSSGHTDPKWYTVAPVKSVRELLKKLNLEIGAFDIIEENEAFAAQTLAVMKELSIEEGKINVNGGAIALGHPIGASGARLLVTLTHALKRREKRLGLATLCLGGGGAMSMAVKAL